LLEYGNARESDAGLAELAQTFAGAWPYLTLIADSNRVEDPLDERVVEAYWVGNDLLERVSQDRLARHVSERFGPRLGRTQTHVAGAVAAGAVPHHCFHVFAVYPWLGLLRTGVVEEPLRVLDQCRTTAGIVRAVSDDSVEVLVRPLRWDGTKLYLDHPAPRRARWSDGGLAFVPRPRLGDRVSLHWDFVCDVISSAAARRLEQATRHSLAAVNVASPAITSASSGRQPAR
jgi:hypothetical protein